MRCPVWLSSSFCSIVSGRIPTFLGHSSRTFGRPNVKIHARDMVHVMQPRDTVYAMHFGCPTFSGSGALVRLIAVIYFTLPPCRKLIKCVFHILHRLVNCLCGDWLFCSVPVHVLLLLGSDALVQTREETGTTTTC